MSNSDNSSLNKSADRTNSIYIKFVYRALMPFKYVRDIFTFVCIQLVCFVTLFVSLFTPFPGSDTIQCGNNKEINNLFSASLILWVIYSLGESYYLLQTYITIKRCWENIGET